MRSDVDRPVTNIGACRVLAEIVVALPVARGPDRPRNEAATAVGTDVLEHAIHARGAERALVRADARVRCLGRQRFVAVLARRSKLEHRGPFARTPALALRVAIGWTRHVAANARSTGPCATDMSAQPVKRPADTTAHARLSATTSSSGLPCSRCAPRDDDERDGDDDQKAANQSCLVRRSPLFRCPTLPERRASSLQSLE